MPVLKKIGVECWGDGSRPIYRRGKSYLPDEKLRCRERYSSAGYHKGEVPPCPNRTYLK